MKTDPELYSGLLYTCDAALTSDKDVYNTLVDLSSKHKKYTGLFARYLFPKVAEIAKGQDIFGKDGIHEYQCRCIAKDLAETLVQQYKEG